MIIRNRVAAHSCQLVCGQCCGHRNGAFRRWARGAHLRARPHRWTTAGVHVAQHASGSRPEGARWSQSRAVECAVWRSAAQRRRELGQCGSHVRTLWSSRAGAHAKHALGRVACSSNVGDAYRTQCRGRPRTVPSHSPLSHGRADANAHARSQPDAMRTWRTESQRPGVPRHDVGGHPVRR